MAASLASSMSFKRALERAFFLAFLGILCLSNVYVQGQVATPSGSQAATSTGSLPSGSTGNPQASGTPTGSATLPGPTGPLPSTKPSDPPAHLSMLEPKADIKNPPLFPLGKDIVFAWTITDIQNLIMKPTNLTIEAYLSDKIIVTIASGLPGNTMNYTWPAENQKNATNPIQTKEIYTIRIFDGQVGRYGRIAGGYLETYTSLKIGLYQPGAYTPGKDLFPPVCATCDFSKITNGVTRSVLPGVFIALITLLSTSVALW